MFCIIQSLNSPFNSEASINYFKIRCVKNILSTNKNIEIILNLLHAAKYELYWNIFQHFILLAYVPNDIQGIQTSGLELTTLNYRINVKYKNNLQSLK